MSAIIYSTGHATVFLFWSFQMTRVVSFVAVETVQQDPSALGERKGQRSLPEEMIFTQILEEQVIIK